MPLKPTHHYKRVRRKKVLDFGKASQSAVFCNEARATLRSAAGSNREFSQEVESLVERIDGILKGMPEALIPRAWMVMAAGLHTLASQLACLAIAERRHGNLVSERSRAEILMSRLRSLLSSYSFQLPDHLQPVCESVLEGEHWDPEPLCRLLATMPLPTLYWCDRKPLGPPTDVQQSPEVLPEPMVRVVVSLDRVPVASPQLLRANVLYGLEFRVRGLAWPDNAIRLHLTLSTTIPQSEYSVSEFTMQKPISDNRSEFDGTLTGYIKFGSEQSSWIDDLVFSVNCAFEAADGLLLEVPVIGHNALRLRVFDKSSSSLWTGDTPAYSHTLDLLEKLAREVPQIADELPELFEVTQALSRLLAAYAHEAIYKGQSDVTEEEFQTQVLRDLRIRLGPDVQEHTEQAGGITDIRCKGVIVELKVERENGDRGHIADKYSQQVVQYTGVEARQISVLLVLDLTPKENPPGDIRNDILLKDVETHGGDGEFPSKVLVFVVNGNTNNPSDYSRS